MGVAPSIDITAGQRKTILTLLERHLPGTEAWVYGSRAKWTSRSESDLDLVVFARPEQNNQVAALRDAFEESDLPFRVDLFVWNEVPVVFRKEIELEHVTLSGEDQHDSKEGNGKWMHVAIGDIAEIVGGSTPSTKNADNFDGDIPWLTPRDLSGPHNRFVTRGDRNLSKKGLASCSARLLPRGAVLLSTRAPIGYVALAGNEIATNQGFRNLIVHDNVCPEFVYYWLKSNTKELERHASGSTFRELSGSSLKQISISLPPLSEQRAIARVLGTLDDKIESNRRMNETLEAIARALFKSWFVDFDPVRAKMEDRDTGLPRHIADLFPDRLVDSELGEIPEGWRVGCLDDVAGSPRRSVNPTGLCADTSYIGLEHMPRHSIALTEWESSEKVTSNKSAFRKGEILFGKLRPYFHKVGLAPVDGVCSTDIVVVAPKNTSWSAFVLALLSSVDFVKYTDHTSTGTKMPRTSWKIMCRYEICLPAEPVTQAFQNIVGPMLERAVVNIHSNRLLVVLRDTLLPKLVSGEIRVPDAEKVVEALA